MKQGEDKRSSIEQQLRASDERYQAFIKNSNEGIWRFEVNKPILTKLKPAEQIKLMYKYAYLAEANDAMAKMYGLSSVDDIVGARLGDFLIEEDPENIDYLTAFIKSKYRLSGVDSHEKDSQGNDKYFRNSLVGVVEKGHLVRAWGTQSDVTEQRKIDMALANSEERLSRALEASQTGLWEWDVKTGKLMWSRQLKKIFGLKPSDKITYEKYQKMIHPQDRERVIAAIQKSMQDGKNYVIEHRVIWPDKSVHWTQGQGQAYLEDGKPIRMIGTSMNIDKRKDAEIQSRATEERLTLALKSTNMGTWESRMIPGAEIWSKGLKQLVGMKPTEILTRESFLNIIHPDDKDRWLKNIKKAENSGKPYTIEYRVVWPDGSVHWILGQGQAYLDKNGKAIRMVGTTMNIDDRKKYEIEVQESEARFRNMADTAPVLIWVAGPDKQLTYFNKPWQDFTGRKLEDDLGEGWREDIHPDDLDTVVKVYYDAVDKRKPYTLEYRVRRHDGQYRWMLDKGVPRYSPDGEFLGLIGSLIETEEIKSTRKRRDELEKINQKLEDQRRELVALNQSKDEFISLASHQLRTPATGVKQYIGMLLEGYGGKLNKDQIHMLSTAYDSNERQLNIIDDLLKVAHVDAGKVALRKHKTDLVRLIDEVIDEQSDKFRHKNQTTVFNHKSKRVFATIDPERMRMVLENLIDNAGKYTPEGKKITVTLVKTTKEVRLTIADQGVGIAKRDLPKLFQKFTRVSNPLSTVVGGSGLGLYWAEKIVSLHKGSITVESKLHKGSKFIIKIPI